jgi:hypothetical protein
MLMFTRTHARLAASDAKKIGEQARLIAKLTTQNRELKTRNVDLWATKDDAVERAQKVFAANLKLAAENAGLRKRLSPFTTLPPRGAGGKFVSTKGAQA